MDSHHVITVEVDRRDLHRVRVVEGEPAALEPGQVRLRVDAFALTANNVTYAVAGDMLRYWSVFPAEGPWGRIPVWGFADVVESRHDDVEVATRWYGYLPMSTELVVEPGRIDDRGFVDVAAHRAGLAGAYNRYVRVPADPSEAGAPTEEQRMVLYPLFFTSFLIDDLLGDHLAAGVERVVVSSASSKTSLGTAFCLHRRVVAGHAVEVVGLTSAANVGFVESLGVYDSVLAYDDVAAVSSGPAAFVDVAGDVAVRASVHHHLGDDLQLSLGVGATHWQALGGGAGDLPGPTPVSFFAPTRIAERTAEWGGAELDRRLGEAWVDYCGFADGWIRLERGAGSEAVEAAYRSLLDNRADPAVGHVLTLHR